MEPYEKSQLAKELTKAMDLGLDMGIAVCIATLEDIKSRYDSENSAEPRLQKQISHVLSIIITEFKTGIQKCPPSTPSPPQQSSSSSSSATRAPAKPAL